MFWIMDGNGKQGSHAENDWMTLDNGCIDYWDVNRDILAVVANPATNS